ncbi:MAG: hypothetical protein B6U68_00425 [Candidatus Aenigmarchaeota archaeon ex4484_14]|nr:MAG: hypothetical protein B6U68_00425 [Candidatus Aenigmarchaeota archaeon ex4484_14]
MKRLFKLILLFFCLLFSSFHIAHAIQDTINLLDKNNNDVTSANAWDNITIKVVNSAAEIYTANVTSTADPNGITVYLTGSSGTYTGWFITSEATSSSDEHIIQVTDGSTVTVTADMDGDGNAGTDTLTYDNDPDNIRTYRTVQSNPYNETQTSYFSVGQTVYVYVFAGKNGAQQMNVKSNADTTGISVTLTESSTYPGWYEGNFSTSTSSSNDAQDILKVFSNDTITITSDVEGDDATDATKTITVLDQAYLLDSDGENLTKINAWDNVTVKIYNPSMNRDTTAIENGTVIINSTNDATGISLTVIETGANTGIFEATFQAAEVSSSQSNKWINASDGATVYVWADIDGNGVYATDSVDYDVNPDEVIVRRGSASGTIADYVNSDDEIFVEVYATANMGTGSVTINSTTDPTGTTITVTEDSTYKGKYLGSFNISSTTVAGSSIHAENGDTINIISDIDNNDASDTIKTIYLDSARPTIYSHTPANNVYVQSSQNRTIEVTLHDNIKTASTITLHWRFGSDSWNSGEMSIKPGSSQGTTTVYTKTINESSASSGSSISFYVTGYDNAGNSIIGGGNKSSPLCIYYLDDTAPSITIKSPTSGQDIGATFTLNITWSPTYSPNITEAYYEITNGSDTIKNKTIDLSDSNCGNTSCIIEDIKATDWPLGSLNLTVYAKDTAGNVGSKTVAIDSVADARLTRALTIIPSDRTINNTGTDKFYIKFYLSVKGDYIRVKMTDLKYGSHTIDIDNITIMTYTDYQNKQRTYDVKNDFDETQEVYEIKDNIESTKYAKETTVTIEVSVPADVPPGNYTSTYTIGVYT